VQIDSLAVRLRPRTWSEAADLGARLCQRVARSLYPCFLLAGLPVSALCLATFEIAPWLPMLTLWWSKPWLDRTILFVLSRAAFGQRTSPADVWGTQREVWWRHLLFTLTLRRLSPWRSYTQPAYQLEGLSAWQARRRVLQLRNGRGGPALLMTSAFASAESALTVALLSLLYWFAPGEGTFTPASLLELQGAGFMGLLPSLSYALVVLFLEPFYVAAGFAMYLNRRAELEAWDIEQEFRRAFAR
jgi:hypothetical protein